MMDSRQVPPQLVFRFQIIKKRFRKVYLGCYGLEYLIDGRISNKEEKEEFENMKRKREEKEMGRKGNKKKKKRK